MLATHLYTSLKELEAGLKLTVYMLVDYNYYGGSRVLHEKLFYIMVCPYSLSRGN